MSWYYYVFVPTPKGSTGKSFSSLTFVCFETTLQHTHVINRCNVVFESLTVPSHLWNFIRCKGSICYLKTVFGCIVINHSSYLYRTFILTLYFVWLIKIHHGWSLYSGWVKLTLHLTTLVLTPIIKPETLTTEDWIVLKIQTTRDLKISQTRVGGWHPELDISRRDKERVYIKNSCTTLFGFGTLRFKYWSWRLCVTRETTFNSFPRTSVSFRRKTRLGRDKVPSPAPFVLYPT